MPQPRLAQRYRHPFQLACYTSLREAGVKAKRKFTVVIERDEEGYYVATVPALRGCHTQAKNLDTLMKRVREVVELCVHQD